MQAFVRSHLLLPMTLFACVLFADIYFELDQQLVDFIFSWEGNHWQLRHHWLTKTVLHEDGRWLVGLMLSVLLLSLMVSFWRRLPWHTKLRPYRGGLVYLTLTILLCLMIINGLKAISGAPCPWHLTQYGGNLELRHWFTGFNGQHGCFPAGHASGGYIWVALYYFALMHFPKYRYACLAIGIGLGLVFGIAQQLRGAHFFSHDLATLAICWFTSFASFMLWFSKRSKTLA